MGLDLPTYLKSDIIWQCSHIENGSKFKLEMSSYSIHLCIGMYYFCLFHCKLLFPTSCLLPWVDSLHIFQNSARDLRQKWPICLVLSHNFVQKILREFLKSSKSQIGNEPKKGYEIFRIRLSNVWKIRS